MRLISSITLVGSLLCATIGICPRALAAATANVRIVGESSTLLPLTSVVLDKPDPLASGCPLNSANAAINSAVEAVGGTWDHGNEEGSSGDFTETILGETHIFEQDGTTWDVWINDKWAGGICEDLLGEGDELLIAADHPTPTFAPTRLPLTITEAPSSAIVGTPFTVRVEKVQTRPGTYPEVGEGSLLPDAGARVEAGGASEVTNAQGDASLTLRNPGTFQIVATQSGGVPAAPVSICARAADEAGCGSGPATSTVTAHPLAGSGTTTAAPYKGPYALVAAVSSVQNGHTYTRADAPRLLAGTIESHSAVSQVSLKLRRDHGGRCSAYEGARGRFVRTRCGSGRFFLASSDAEFSYLLPKKLGPGRYVLDVQALDVAGNETTLARGSSRLVFFVR